MGFLRSWTLTRQNILCLVLDRDEVSLTEEARGGRQLDLESWIVDSVEVDSEGRKELLCVVSLANKYHEISYITCYMKRAAPEENSTRGEW